MMLRTHTPTPIQIPCRSGTASPTSTAVSLSYVNVAKLPSALDLGRWSSTILQTRPAVTNSLYADAVRQDVAYSYDLSPLPLPSPLLLGVPQAGGLDGMELLHQANSVLVQVRVPVIPLDRTSPFCQEIQPADTHAAAAISSESSSPGAYPHSSAASTPPTCRKSKDYKKNTTMCKNGPSCTFHKRNHCVYAHSPDELRRFSLLELKETNKDKDYLSYVCFDFVMTGYW